MDNSVLNVGFSINSDSQQSKRFEIEKLSKEFSVRGYSSRLIGAYEQTAVDYFSQSINDITINISGYPTDTHCRYLIAQESQGSKTLNNTHSSLIAANKMLMYLKIRSQNILTPKTIDLNPRMWGMNLNDSIEQRIGAVIGYPCVIKIPNLGMGLGVYKVDSEIQCRDLLALLKCVNNSSPQNLMYANLLAQEFISESAGRAVRVIVLNNEPLGAFLKTSNTWKISGLEGERSRYTMSDELYNISATISKLFDLGFCGIDYHLSNRGYMIGEINISPQFSVFDNLYPNIDIAKRIVEYLILK